MSKANVLKDIEPVAQMDIWDGEMKIYESMAEYNKQIKRVNVYTENQVLSLLDINQPKLSIPKKIAEELEEYDAGRKGNYSLFSLSEEAREFYLTHNNIVTIYFASKALGVELVEVTDE